MLQPADEERRVERFSAKGRDGRVASARGEVFHIITVGLREPVESLAHDRGPFGNGASDLHRLAPTIRRCARPCP